MLITAKSAWAHHTSHSSTITITITIIVIVIETMRSGSISPSTSIRSFNSESDSEASDDTSRYADMSAEELTSIWERRNLAYFDRRQRKLAEERQQQHPDLSGGDVSVAHDSCSSNSNSSASALEQLGAGFAATSSSPHPQTQRAQQRQQLTRPAGFTCAADDPQWRALTSRNIMGDCYDSKRASREPAYHDAWVSCQRLVNMRRSGAAAAGNFIPTNPRLAALLEHRRLEVARERYEEETTVQREHQFTQVGVGADQQHDNDSNNMMLDDYRASQEPSPLASLSAQQAAEQAAEYERVNQEHRLQQQEFTAHAQGNNSNLKTASIDCSAGAGEKSVQLPVKNSYYMALPYPTQQLPKSVYCDQCNCELFTSHLAKRFFCQTCGSVACVPVPNVDSSFDEKMQDAEDQD